MQELLANACEDRTDAPIRRGFWRSVASCWKKTFCLKGRASCSEFWFFMMWNFLSATAFIALVAGIVRLEGVFVDAPRSGIMRFNFGLFTKILAPACLVYCVALVFPTLSALVRRLHDSGLPGFLNIAWLCLLFYPLPNCNLVGYDKFTLCVYLMRISGVILFLYLLCRFSTSGANKYGPDPRKNVL